MSYYQHDNAAKPGVQLAHTMYGDKVTASAPLNATQDGVGPATWSTAPYKPPARRHRDNPDLALCAVEDCKGYPIKNTGHCAGHARSLGLLPSCAQPGCKAWPKKDAVYCRHHLKVPADGDAG